MDSLTYINIFETKALEYLLLLSFWALFVFLVRYLRPPKDHKRKPR
jgi:hypothetical protein